MSRFLVAMFVGATIAAAVSTSASAWHCLASSPNGAAGTAFEVKIDPARADRRQVFLTEEGRAIVAAIIAQF